MEVVEAEPARATLSYHHAAGEWPWAFEAIQRTTLTRGPFARRGRFQVNLSPTGAVFIAEPVQYANIALSAPPEE